MIRGAVREAGDRAKVAVFSRERDVDPVGACVGMKGTRVQSIIRELRGEKIDIVEFSEDPIAFVTNALSPAKVQRVSIVDDHERVMEVIVEDKQLSLAIGKKGQNVRLAAKLTGWRIDIKSEEEKRREVEAQFEGLEALADPVAEGGETPEPAEAAGDEPVAAAVTESAGDTEAPLPYGLSGVGDKTVRKLVEAGYATPEALAAVTAEQLSQIPGIGAKTAEKILVAARGESGAPAALPGSPDNDDEPGSHCPAEARSRHRREERIEHHRRGRGAPIRRPARPSAQHHAADRRHLCRDADCEGEESRPRQEGAGARQACRPGSSTASAGQDGQAARSGGAADRRAGGWCR